MVQKAELLCIVQDRTALNVKRSSFLGFAILVSMMQSKVFFPFFNRVDSRLSLFITGVACLQICLPDNVLGQKVHPCSFSYKSIFIIHFYKNN